MSAQCISCSQTTDKYKCPKCLEPYCSLDCFKTHKTNGCQSRAEPQTPAKPHEEDEPTIHEPFSTDDTVPPEKLLQLKDSEGLKNLLYNPHLRNLLSEIDVAPNAWKAIRAAMLEPLFVEFADECLKVIEPMTEEEQQEQLLLRL